jgi:hypothetical protein
VTGEREKLQACVRAATDCAPLIVRGVVNATHASRPLSWRQHQLNLAIRRARELLDDLVTQQTALGWRDREGDAA